MNDNLLFPVCGTGGILIFSFFYIAIQIKAFSAGFKDGFRAFLE